MDKKIIAIVLVAVGLLAIAAGAIFIFNSGDEDQTIESSNTNTTEGEGSMDKDSKTIVVYFSAENIGADIFEIEPVQKYTEDDLSWTSSTSRVSREHNDASLQDVELKTASVPNWDEYETVFLGYPIWWGGSAWPMDSFVKQNDFGGKTVIPFCTSHSSGIGTSDIDLKAKAIGGNWQSGHRFSQDATDEDIKAWTDKLN